jgi:hypothetical protein
LAEDLNKFKGQHPSSKAERYRPAINPLPTDACKIPEEASSQAKEMCFQEDREIEGHLLRSRIPASHKGKAVQGADGIHDFQATSSAAQATTSMTTAKTAPSDITEHPSTRLQQHQMGIVISEEGWETAKLHRRKRPDMRSRTVQTTHLPRDK